MMMPIVGSFPLSSLILHNGGLLEYPPKVKGRGRPQIVVCTLFDGRPLFEVRPMVMYSVSRTAVV